MEPQQPSDRQFGLTVGGVLVAAGIWRMPEIALPGVVLMLLGLVRPAVLHTPNRLWMRMSHAIGRVTTPVMMALLFFCVITPLGFVMRRMYGYQPLQLEFDREAKSYWSVRETDAVGDMRNQF
ncbi:hypothetical protein F183_A14480 [Bryobacterales bacterium F-183]|nr:hypothetical protein F183_A14480 [Bryobacterales bacterium F-183]